MTEEQLNKLTGNIIGIAIEVHCELGQGLLEKVYQKCLKIALEEAGYQVKMEVSLPVIFRGKVIEDDGYRIDLLVNDTVILEIKSVSSLTTVFEKQLGTYLRLANKPCGLLINFNVPVLKQGIKRIRNGYLGKKEDSHGGTGNCRKRSLTEGTEDTERKKGEFYVQM